MDLKTGFFYFFSLVLLFAATRVILARNPVHAVLYLMLAFSQASAIWLLLQAEFLAIALVLVYLGAVMVLFLFVVMMIDVDVEALRKGFWKHFPLAAFVGVLIALEMAAVLLGGFRGDVEPRGASMATNAVGTAGQAAQTYSNTRELGVLLYTEYLYPLEIAAVLLLVAIIAAIALTLRRRKDTRYLDPSDQIKVRADDRLDIVKMAASKPGAVPTTAADAEKTA